MSNFDSRSLLGFVDDQLELDEIVVQVVYTANDRDK